MKRLVLHIDRLVLSGLRRADRHEFAASLRTGLGQRLGAVGGASSLLSKISGERIACPTLRVSLTTSPARMGKRVAHAIIRGMKT